MPKTRNAGVDAPALHRIRGWTGAGWWRRKAWITHEPIWRTISEGAGGIDLQLCYGDRRCIVTRQATRTGAVITASSFAAANDLLGAP
jgi:hypothetical protein